MHAVVSTPVELQSAFGRDFLCNIGLPHLTVRSASTVQRFRGLIERLLALATGKFADVQQSKLTLQIAFGILVVSLPIPFPNSDTN